MFVCVCVTGHQKSETVSSASESGTSETSADQHRPELKDQFFQCPDWFLQSVYQDMHGQPGQQGQVSGFVFYNCLHYIYNMFTSISVLVTAETCSVALQIQSLYQIVFVFGCLFTSTFLKVSHIGFLFTRQTAHMCPWLNCRQRPCLLASYTAICMVHIRDRNYISSWRVSGGWGNCLHPRSRAGRWAGGSGRDL